MNLRRTGHRPAADVQKNLPETGCPGAKEEAAGGRFTSEKQEIFKRSKKVKKMFDDFVTVFSVVS
jgi:hypothetical protein